MDRGLKLGKMARQVGESAKTFAWMLRSLRSRFGERSVMLLGDQSLPPVEVISTGFPAVDIALGCGGLPRGRLVELFGGASSGKTALSLLAIASCQEAGGRAAFIDAEHSLDPSFARKLGVHLDRLLVSQPESGEQALAIVDALVRSGSVDLVVVDSVAALVPKEEIGGEMGEAEPGLHSRLMSQALRRLVGAVSRSGTSLVFLNQIRNRLGGSFGGSETTTGGHALKFYASVRIELRRIATTKEGGAVVGSRSRVKVVKNKVGPPFGEAEVEIRFAGRSDRRP